MNLKSIRQLILVMLAQTLLSASGQVTLSGTSYTQNFNAISNGLPVGWSVRTNATATSLGLVAAFNTANVTWGAQTGQFGNAAGTTNNSLVAATGNEDSNHQDVFTNRCPCIRQTAAFGDPGAAFVFQITNTIGFSNLVFSVDLSLLKSNGYSTTWTIDYAVSNTPASFTVLGTCSDPGCFWTTNRSFVLGTNANNQTNNVWIRIVALGAATGNGSRDTFGIDNFVLNYAGATPPPAAVPLFIQTDGTNAVLVWNDTSFTLQSAPATTGTYTNVTGATSPFTNALDAPAKFFRLIH